MKLPDDLWDEWSVSEADEQVSALQVVIAGLVFAFLIIAVLFVVTFAWAARP